jgi:hypothetical protein
MNYDTKKSNRGMAGILSMEKMHFVEQDLIICRASINLNQK